MATSSTLSLGRLGLRCSSSRMHRMTRSSARVWAYMPLSPALPNGVRTPSTKTTSLSARGTVPPSGSRVDGPARTPASGRDSARPPRYYFSVTSRPTGLRVTILTTARRARAHASGGRVLGAGEGDERHGDRRLPATCPHGRERIGDLGGRRRSGTLPQEAAQQVRGQEVLDRHGELLGDRS